MNIKEDLRWIRDKIKELKLDNQAEQRDIEKLEDKYAALAVDLNWTGEKEEPELTKLKEKIMGLVYDLELRRLDLNILKTKERRLAR